MLQVCRGEMWQDCYLDDNKLLLQGFSIRKLLPKAHVDGVFRRPTMVLLKLPQLWAETQVDLLDCACQPQTAPVVLLLICSPKRAGDLNLPSTYLSKLRSSTSVFWGSFLGSGWATLGSLVLANTWHLSCLQAQMPVSLTSRSRPFWMLFRMRLVYSIWYEKVLVRRISMQKQHTGIHFRSWISLRHFSSFQKENTHWTVSFSMIRHMC